METTLLQWAINQGGMVAVLLLVVYFLGRHYLKREDRAEMVRDNQRDLLKQALEVNAEHAKNITDCIEKNGQRDEEVKAMKDMVEIGKWWVTVHKPSEILCGQCDEYPICKHPGVKYIKLKK